jgi:hypothetical protein
VIVPSRMTRPTLPIIVAGALTMGIGLGAAIVAPAAQAPDRTAALATELTGLLQQRKLDAAAARLDEETFVAALFYPGSELLVVSAKYSAPSLLVQKLADKKYRDIYLDLASASVPESKVLIEDLKADGLRASRDDDDPFDVVTKGSTGVSVNFDGDWKRQNLSEGDYAKLFQETEATYAALLQALVDELKKSN